MFGRRSGTTIGGVTTSYLYDDANVVQERVAGTPVAMLLNGSHVDEVFARVEASGVSTVLSDVLSSTVALTDAAGAVSTEYTYTPHGQPTVTGASTSSQRAFTGRDWDGSSGLFYYRARFYSPQQSRFVSRDPLGFRAGDTNLYAYVSGDPVAELRPRWACCCISVFEQQLPASSIMRICGTISLALILRTAAVEIGMIKVGLKLGRGSSRMRVYLFLVALATRKGPWTAAARRWGIRDRGVRMETIATTLSIAA